MASLWRSNLPLKLFRKRPAQIPRSLTPILHLQFSSLRELDVYHPQASRLNKIHLKRFSSRTYHEEGHQNPCPYCGLGGPGPQRVIIGKAQDVYQNKERAGKWDVRIVLGVLFSYNLWRLYRDNEKDRAKIRELQERAEKWWKGQ